MKIAGFHKNSFVDYPGHIASVIFTFGCNMNCFYCHNRTIVSDFSYHNLIAEDEIFSFLLARKKLLDGVVISGGEPTIQSSLDKFIKRIKNMGYSVKLDTNGTNPYMVEQLISSGLIDYVAMDIKATSKKYTEICGKNINTKDILKTIEILMTSNIDYEFRTTFVPQLNEKDIMEIVHIIKGANLYVLQQFRPNEYMTKFRDISPHTPQYIKKVAEDAGKLVRCITRGI